jgi:hypothetical protein
MADGCRQRPLPVLDLVLALTTAVLERMSQPPPGCSGRCPRLLDGHLAVPKAGDGPTTAEEIGKRIEALRTGGSRRDWLPY